MSKQEAQQKFQFSHIGSLIQNQLRSLDLTDKMRAQQIVEEWEEVVGEKVAAHAKSHRYQHWTLYVRVDSSVWLHDLSFLKGRYIQDLNRRLGSYLVREIRFELGQLPPPKKSPVEEELPPPRPHWSEVEIPAEIRDEIEGKLAHLPEDEIKQSARRIMLNNYRVREEERKRQAS